MSTFGNAEYKCPLCSEIFNYGTQFSYSTFGVNLDFKPFGAAIIPTPVPKCPKCNFVFFNDMFAEEEIKLIKIELEKNNIFENEKDMPNYYYLAKEFEILGKDISTIIYYYHSAIWEDNDKKHFENIANIVFSYFEKINETDENFYIYKLIKLDFLRRLQKNNIAIELIEKLKKDTDFPNDKFGKVLKYQFALISKNDIDEHEMPEETNMKDYYRVILGKKSSMADECYNAGFIGVGFNREEDITEYLFDTVKEFNAFFVPKYLSLRPEKDRQQAISGCSSLWTVSKKINIGDIVLSPKNVDQCYVGIVTSDYYFEQGAELPNRRNIKWYSTIIDKKSMSSELATSVWLNGTVHSLNKYAEEIEGLIIE
ncbi:MAG: hypothetical protein FWG07_09720 [Treponema sp.]|nr:hypothetical protein [Treponema sp.]